MDYVLSEALAYKSEGLPSALVMYDIMCQYGVHMVRRFNHSPYIQLPPEMEIYKGIGLFHVHGHKEDCFAKFAPNFIFGAGMVAGEIIESDWPFLNAVAATTRFMTEAHRREVLDHHLNDMNFMKLLRTRECPGLVWNIFLTFFSGGIGEEIKIGLRRSSGKRASPSGPL